MVIDVFFYLYFLDTYIYIIRHLHFWETTILWFPFGPLPGPASKIAPCATLPEPAQCAEMVAKRQQTLGNEGENWDATSETWNFHQTLRIELTNNRASDQR